MPMRWVLVALLFFSSVLNYLDRQTLAILAPTIQKDLGISDPAYANINNAFLIAYTISYLASGYLTDRIGPRWALGIYLTFWSVANMLTGLARSAWSLGIFRFLLGLGEAGNWTAAPKLVSQWFSPKERGLAVGIYSLGSTIGATIAPPMVVWLASTGHWQNAFFATGAAGLLWLIPWFALYRGNPPAPAATLETETKPESVPPARYDAWHERPLWQQPALWALLFARLLTDPLWYFVQTWFAKYLVAERGMSQQDVSITWLIFLAADIGAVGGGWLSGIWVKRGHAPIRARLLVMLGCALLTPCIALVPSASTIPLALTFTMIATMAHLAWLINISTLVTDVVPEKNLATVFGLVAAGSTVGGIVMNQLVGNSVAQFGYGPAFLGLCLVHLTAIGLLFTLIHGKKNNVRSNA